MNPYAKKFILRGFMFAGLGPIVLGIVYFILDSTGTRIELTGGQILLGIITTYIIAFVHSAVSSLPSIESWSKVKAMFLQLLALYTVYTCGYLINNWIPFNPIVLVTYTCIFIGVFLLIWIVIVVSVHLNAKKLNQKLNVQKQQKE